MLPFFFGGVLVDLYLSGVTNLKRENIAGEGWKTIPDEGGGSQTLAEVLAAGGDPDGNPITGAVTISPSDPEPISLDLQSPSTAEDGYQLLSIGGTDGAVIEAYADGTFYVSSRLGATPGTPTIQCGSAGNIILGAPNAGQFTILASRIVKIPQLPTEDPAVANQLWNDAGTLKVSAG